MDNEVQKLLDNEMNKLMQMTYSDLDSIVDCNESIESSGAEESGEEYQISIRAWYDDKKTKTIRVSGAIYKTKNRGFLSKLGIDKSVASRVFLINRQGEFLE